MQWVRDIDLSSSTMLEDFEKERNKKETEMNEREEERERKGERERERERERKREKEREGERDEDEESEERKSEEKTEEDEEIGENEEVRAFTAKIDNDKLTDRNIKFRDDYQKFVAAKDDEIENAFDTGTFKRVEKYNVPVGTKIYNMMWIHKIKPATKLEPERYRSRLCVLGNRQDANSYSQTFAAVAKVKMFRLLLSVSVFFGLRMTQIDISNAFMYADLDREIYAHPPPGYEHLGVLKLEKSLYGLKQAPRLWYDTMTSLLTKKVGEGGLGFRQLRSDVCCFTHPTKRCYVLMYVDDICIFTKDEELRQEILSCLKENFKLRNFDTSGVYLGLELDWSESGDRVKVHQTSYIEKLLQVFRMEGSDAVHAPALSKVKLSRTDPVSENAANRPYRSLIGGLLYTLGSRPDAASAIRTCSQYMAEGADLHWQAGKRILRYLKGTKEKARWLYQHASNWYFQLSQHEIALAIIKWQT